MYQQPIYVRLREHHYLDDGPTANCGMEPDAGGLLRAWFANDTVLSENRDGAHLELYDPTSQSRRRYETYCPSHDGTSVLDFRDAFRETSIRLRHVALILHVHRDASPTNVWPARGTLFRSLVASRTSPSPVKRIPFMATLGATLPSLGGSGSGTALLQSSGSLRIPRTQALGLGFSGDTYRPRAFLLAAGARQPLGWKVPDGKALFS